MSREQREKNREKRLENEARRKVANWKQRVGPNFQKHWDNIQWKLEVSDAKDRS